MNCCERGARTRKLDEYHLMTGSKYPANYIVHTVNQIRTIVDGLAIILLFIELWVPKWCENNVIISRNRGTIWSGEVVIWLWNMVEIWVFGRFIVWLTCFFRLDVVFHFKLCSDRCGMDFLTVSKDYFICILLMILLIFFFANDTVWLIATVHLFWQLCCTY